MSSSRNIRRAVSFQPSEAAVSPQWGHGGFDVGRHMYSGIQTKIIFRQKLAKLGAPSIKIHRQARGERGESSGTQDSSHSKSQ